MLAKSKFKKIILMFFAIIFSSVIFILPGCGKTDAGPYTVKLDYDLSVATDYTIELTNETTITEIKSQINKVNGYTIVGLYKDANLTQPFGDDEEISSNTTIYVKLQADDNSIKVNIVTNINEIADYTLNFEDNVLISEIKLNLNVEGYDIVGLYKDENFLVEYADDDVLVANSTIYVKYQIKTFTVSLPQSNASYVVEKVTISNIVEYNHKFEFKVTAVDNRQSVLVFANGNALQPNAQGNYEIIVVENVEIAIEVGSYNKLNFELDAGTYAVSAKSTEITGKVSIPYSYMGVPVTRVARNAFANCTELTEVFMPETITDIGEAAFYNCSNLTNINIPNAITSVGKGAFDDCAQLQTETINNGVYIGNNQNKNLILLKMSLSQQSAFAVEDGTKIIYDGAINGSEYLTSLQLPASVIYINPTDLTDCIHLAGLMVDGENEIYSSQDNAGGEHNVIIYKPSKTIIRGCNLSTIPTDGSVTAIGDRAFYFCNQLNEIALSNHIQTIGEEAFSHCGALTTLTLPSSVLSLGKGAFEYCSGLTSILVDEHNEMFTSRNQVGQEVNAIINKSEHTLIQGCDATTIPQDETVTTIGYHAFAGCENIPNVDLPINIITICQGAFQGCDGLIDVKIPASVNSIGERAFWMCKNLNTIKVDANNLVYTSQDLSHNECNVIIDVANATVIQGCKSSAIPEDGIATKIGNDAFRGSGITKITIPSCITEIGAEAFWHCLSLEEVTIKSEAVYIAANGISNENAGYLLFNPTTIKVLTSIVDDCENEYLENAANFTTSIDNEYTIFTKKEQ